MESQDTISNLENQEQNTSAKLTAAEIILQKLADRKNKSLENLSSEVQNENPAAETADIAQEDGEDDAVSDGEEVQTVVSELPEASMSKEELVARLEEIVKNGDVADLRNEVEVIRTCFYKQRREEIETERQKFLEDEDNKPEVFRTEPDPAEEKFKELFALYREKRNRLNEEIEKEKQENLEKKKEIVAKIENLINSQETLNQTFEEFKNLQKQWRDIGLVPQAEVKKLWESYNYQVERFYDFVKINKELRDLDLKRNTDAKIKLCEKAEELLLEPKVVKAFRELQKLHEQWRETGPVAAAQKEELWERFRLATSKINKRHLEYYENIKKEQEQNFKAKTVICEKAEEIVAAENTTAKEWDTKYKEILELQKIWKLIGFAPKKHNTKVYERFRAACDRFFEKKRDFFVQNREEADNNLQLKEDLCIQAESMKDSTDWNKTTDFFKKIQAKWKTIGPVPKKNSEEIWQRFRAACNHFFENRNKYYDDKDREQSENLKLKDELIAEIEKFTPSDNDERNIAELKEFQKRWASIGQVPRQKKDKILDRYRKAIDAQFAKISIDEAKRNEVRVKNLIDSVKDSTSAFERLRAERSKIQDRINTLHQQVVLSENNLGFFAKSKNAESMIEGFKKKLEKSKGEIAALEKLVALLSKAINETVKKDDKK